MKSLVSSMMLAGTLENSPGDNSQITPDRDSLQSQA